MLVIREEEINSFRKSKYYTVELDCGSFVAVSDKIKDIQSAENVKRKTHESNAYIKSILKEEKKVNPPQLYDLTALQKTANTLLGYTAQQTLNYAQCLYEKSLITYPRTDSRYVNASMKEKLISLVNGSFGYLGVSNDGFTANIDVVIDDSRVSDHHALLPTLSAFDKNKTETVPEAELKLLRLICAQLIYAVSSAHTYESTSITVCCADIDFVAQGKKVVTNGWKGYQTLIQPNISGKEIKASEKLLPHDIAEGLVFENVKSTLSEHYTSPPKHFTESTLLAAMERAGNDSCDEIEMKGIGSPATRAGIIETIIKRGYVQRSGKNLVPTTKGITLIKSVPQEIKSPKLTAQWEHKLKCIEKGELSSTEFMNDIARFVVGIIEKYSDSTIKIEREIFGKCPKCGRNVIENTKAYCCESSKSCGFTIWKTIAGKKLPEGAAHSLLENGQTAKLKGFKKKDGSGKFDAVLVMNDDYTLSFKFK